MNGIVENTHTGMISGYFGSSTVDPNGWIIADGIARSYSSIYDNLIAMGVGTKSLNNQTYTPPNLQAAFLRGAGSQTLTISDTILTYTGPTIGNFLDSRFRSHIHTASQVAHTHDIKALDDNVEKSISGGEGTKTNPTYGLFQTDGGATKVSFNRNKGELDLTRVYALVIDTAQPLITVGDSSTTASTETRPYNIGTLWIIKL